MAFAWPSVSSPMGSPIYAFASHAVSLCPSMRGETGEVPLAALPGEGGLFCLGVTEARSLHDAPTNLLVESTTLDQLTYYSLAFSTAICYSPLPSPLTKANWLKIREIGRHKLLIHRYPSCLVDCSTPLHSFLTSVWTKKVLSNIFPSVEPSVRCFPNASGKQRDTTGNSRHPGQ